jgi:hypothetical protein
MLKFGDKVFVVTSDKLIEGTVSNHISHRGVVTGYAIRSEELSSFPMSTKFVKRDIFIDKEDATKALFKKKLKADEAAAKSPAEDIVGDRHWIAGHKGFGR